MLYRVFLIGELLFQTSLQELMRQSKCVYCPLLVKFQCGCLQVRYRASLFQQSLHQHLFAQLCKILLPASRQEWSPPVQQHWSL